MANCPLCVCACMCKRFASNAFSSLTFWLIRMKLHRKHPLYVLFFWIHAKFWFPWQPKEKHSEHLKSLLLGKCQANFQIICRNVPRVTLYQIPSSHVDWSNTMAAKGLCYFALYGYGENLNQIPLSHVEWLKNMAARRLIGMIFIGSILSMSSPNSFNWFPWQPKEKHSENLKNLLRRKCQAGLQIVL